MSARMHACCCMQVPGMKDVPAARDELFHKAHYTPHDEVKAAHH